MRPLERFLAAANFEIPDQVPVALWFDGDWLANFSGMKALEYYHDPRKMYMAQVNAIRRFPNALIFPGIWADYGIVIESSAFGCKIRWAEDATPFVKGQIIRRPEDVDQLEPPDPYHDGLFPWALKTYEYMMRESEERYKYNFYIARGPMQIAVLLRGIDNFLLDMRLNPNMAHKLLEICTKTTISWLKTQIEVFGEPVGALVSDDIPGFVSPKIFDEFGFRYYKKIFDELRHYDLLRLYHNDANTNHILERLADTGMQVFNFGPEMKVSEVKRRVGKRICLWGGNIDPVDILLRGSPADVERACKESIKNGGPGGGYVLSPGGGPVQGTPPENIDVLIHAATKYGKYPIKTDEN